MPSKASIRITASAGARAAVQVQAQAKARAQALAQQAIKVQVEAMASASAAEVARIMEGLLASGDVVLAELPEDEGPESADQALEDAILSDYDWSDEDAESFDPDTPLSRHVFVIRVCRDGQGGIRCLPPYSDWAGAEGKTELGRAFLKTHNNRLRTYRVIGEYLVREHAAELRKGPSALVLDLQQQTFAGEWLQAEKVDKTQLSRFLKECDLVWDADLGGGSMPVRKLFCEQ